MCTNSRAFKLATVVRTISSIFDHHDFPRGALAVWHSLRTVQYGTLEVDTSTTEISGKDSVTRARRDPSKSTVAALRHRSLPV